MMKEKLCYVGYNIHAEIKLAQVLNVLYMDCTWVYLMCLDKPDVGGST